MESLGANIHDQTMDLHAETWIQLNISGHHVLLRVKTSQLTIIREQNVERIFSDNTSFNRFVISEAILKCLQLILDSYGKDSILP